MKTSSIQLPVVTNLSCLLMFIFCEMKISQKKGKKLLSLHGLQSALWGDWWQSHNLLKPITTTVFDILDSIYKSFILEISCNIQNFAICISFKREVRTYANEVNNLNKD